MRCGVHLELASDAVQQLGLLLCHGLPSLGPSSSDISTCFSSGRREKVAPVARTESRGPLRVRTDEHKPRKESASQWQREAKTTVRNKGSE